MKARKVKGLDPDAPLVDNARRIVQTRLDELHRFVPEALDPARARELHDMRIAAKRLRYVLEVTAHCFGPYADTGRKRTKELQDIIGEIHDCDVLLPRVDELLAELRAAGFVDYDPPEGREEGVSDLPMTGVTVVLVSDGSATLGYEEWVRPLVEDLTADRDGDGRPDVPLLAVEALGAEEVGEGEAEFTQELRADDTLSARLSTVNNVDRFAGRLAAVLAIQDLAEGRVGHYGRGAQRLIPAPSQ
ncbi:MAG: copper transporter [Actinobacteria bacterium]|nr:copper transporter [Actinomycetota bacterium]